VKDLQGFVETTRRLHRAAIEAEAGIVRRTGAPASADSMR
jgi:hypothetical protein